MTTLITTRNSLFQGILQESCRISTKAKRKSANGGLDKWIIAGGPNREHEVLMELQFNKVTSPFIRINQHP